MENRDDEILYVHPTVLCRVCLKVDKPNKLKELNSAYQNVKLLKNDSTPPFNQQRIVDILEMVTHTKINLADVTLPSKICQVCISYLKVCHGFLTQYVSTQNKLQPIVEKPPPSPTPETPPPSKPPPVELIHGENRYPLSSLVIIEPNVAEQPSDKYSGFLRMLGNEISATFHNKNHSAIKSPPQPSITLQPLDASNDVAGAQVCAFQCVKCKRMFETEPEIVAHTSAPDCERVPIAVCELCGCVSYSRAAVYRHQVMHKGRRNACHLCKKSYTSASHLRYHVATIHHGRQFRFLCSECGKVCNSQMSLRYHMKVHKGVRDFGCSHCGRKFVTREGKERHERSHTNERPFACDRCDRRFMGRSDLATHKYTHTDAKPYWCEVCGKGFGSAWNRKVHMATHSGPFACSICRRRSFLKVEFLEAHIKKKHQRREREAGDESEEEALEEQEEEELGPVQISIEEIII